MGPDELVNTKAARFATVDTGLPHIEIGLLAMTTSKSKMSDNVLIQAARGKKSQDAGSVTPEQVPVPRRQHQ
ncbi:hypothetical protein RclHR1_00850023 [Rhizophagus clarus]|uniref:Uncharacterized protein n=1 Tax=Rhizophagus clarus TaxID=94130 RepID=A0A2Z6SG49_9GLOM|nr:hypothetical protein RclHR1_00850023 [Rhizophagus clarus]